MDKRVILASKSPRRIELFEKYGIKAECCPAEIDESIPEGICAPCEIVKHLAKMKASAVASGYGDERIVVAADTLVFCDGSILGKPADKQDARRMMKMLSGREHSVISGLCVVCGEKCVCESVETRVYFRELEGCEIEAYISTDDPYDKAGDCIP